MERICEFEIPMRAVSWKVGLADGRIALTRECREFTRHFRQKLLEVVRRPYFTVPRNQEVELLLNIFIAYDEDFRNPEGNPIPDLDHVVTLIQNVLERILYANDQQISALSVQRKRVERSEDEKIEVRIWSFGRHV